MTQARANISVRLVNPESGYESETSAQVTAAEWRAIDRIICAHDPVYPAAPALLEAGEGLLTAYRALVAHVADDGFDLAADHPASWASRMEAAIQSATGEG